MYINRFFPNWTLFENTKHITHEYFPASTSQKQQPHTTLYLVKEYNSKVISFSTLKNHKVKKNISFLIKLLEIIQIDFYWNSLLHTCLELLQSNSFKTQLQ